MLDGEQPTGRSLPHDIEIEQALLGALMINNDGADQVSFLLPEHFFDPVHERIYETITRRIAERRIASPITIKNSLANDLGLKELGGAQYLYNLTEAAIDIFGVKEYAQTIYDLALKRQLAEIGETVAKRALDITDDSNPLDQISNAEEQLFSLAESGRSEGGFQPFSKSIFEAINTANAAYQRDGGLAGISSGLRDLDSKLGGFRNSDLLILAGRPSMGKTALVTNLAYNIASAFEEGEDEQGHKIAISGGRVGFFSLEMSAEQLAGRILATEAEIDSYRIQRGELSEDEFRQLAEVAQQLERAPLYIDDTPAMPISTVAARARRLKRQHGLDLLIVDYLQLCRGSAKSGDNRVQEVSEITQGLKAIAKELNIPVIALSQLSRKVEERDDKRPQLSDLRESGSIEQDADAVMFVYREEYYVGRREPREGSPEHAAWKDEMEAVYGKAEVIIGKQRHGPIGNVELAFDSSFTRFGDLAKEDRHPQLE
ncbi:MAG: replicative DNA helicase [Neomegalonema sp.]|nr:replicative DNA helicase [Neomegalonema sp.]